eukprot:CAMPEP_0181129742 /NCGR_PEP_ID=MMETSP1071-20121207/29484_1 /TAXON_ID=35127 /ORGANISM="Thalassiosira sp., Strain NH16" /LENGTH=314 /DNA_ID=CAMNT_0023215749 /DNA_START=27 /DNA_END=971 /DNA_ORIENTATION=+
MVQNMMSFFEQRYKEHQRIYTHHKTQRVNFEICDILLLAEPHFRGDDINAPPPDAISLKLPVSRAMINPDSYLELTDHVLDQIMQSDTIELRPARILIKRLRSHKIYQRIHTQIINNESWTQALWEMRESSIVAEVLKLSKMDMSDNDSNDLGEDDIIVEKMQIHHGMKDKNPVDFMRFLPKKYHRQLLNSPQNLPTAVQIPGSTYRKPDIFLQKSVRVFCRSSDHAKEKRLKKYYAEFIGDLRNQEEPNAKNYSFQFDGYIPQTPTGRLKSIPLTQESPPSVTQSPNKYVDNSPHPDVPKSLLDKVKKRSRNY